MQKIMYLKIMRLCG